MLGLFQKIKEKETILKKQCQSVTESIFSLDVTKL